MKAKIKKYEISNKPITKKANKKQKKTKTPKNGKPKKNT